MILLSGGVPKRAEMRPRCPVQRSGSLLLILGPLLTTTEPLLADNKELYGKALFSVQLFSFKKIALEPLLGAFPRSWYQPPPRGPTPT